MKLAIAERKEIAANTVEVAFDIRGREFNFRAGQYIRVALPRLLYDDERGGSRCFSIASSPNDKKFLRIAFRASESGYKRTFAEMAIGSEVEIEGPLGDMLLPEDTALPVVFVAGGIGITPFLSMLRFAAEGKRPYRITLIYANKNPESAAYQKELEEIAGQNANLILRNHFGIVDAKTIKENADENDIKNALWYVVGPPAMAMETERILYELGVERGKVRLTEFVGYAVPSPAADKANALPGFAEAFLHALDKNVLVSITDLRGAIIYANDKFTEASRYSREELIGQNHRILKSGFHDAKFYQELWRTISEGRVWRGEIKNLAKDGSFYWVDAIITQILRENGKPFGYVAIRFLITEQKAIKDDLKRKNKELADSRTAILNMAEDIEEERKKVETEVQLRTRELKKEQARLITTINSLPSGLIFIDTENNILLTNTSLSRILELSGSPENWGMADIERKLGDALDIKSQCAACQAGKRPITIKEIPFGAKFLNVYMAPIAMLKDHDEIIGNIVLIDDATEEIVLQRSREEFFAVASHELRTPLTAIRGNMALLKEFFGSALKPEAMEMVDDSYNASLRLIGIVNDFLDVSRLEQQRVEFKKESIDLAALLQETVREVTELAKAKQLSLALVPPDGAIMVVADRDRAKQIAYNLLSNAINYTQQGGITVTLSAQDGFGRVLVTDTGDGISEKNQTLLFRKFQQAGEKVLARDATKSAGLGLYISKLIVEGMGGTIWLERSELGRGSAFAFALPLVS